MRQIEKYLPLLRKTELFAGLDNIELTSILPCVEGALKPFKNGALVIQAGETVSRLGMVLEGALNIVEYDIDGNINLTGKVMPGDIFAEAFMISGRPSAVSVYADADTNVLFMSYNKIISACTNACPFHPTLIGNLVRMLASKLLNARAKLEIMHKNSIRGKLIAFFDMYATKSGSREFNLPFNRSELAEYIGTNRSAMHRELKKMQDEGIITLKGNRAAYHPRKII